QPRRCDIESHSTRRGNAAARDSLRALLVGEPGRRSRRCGRFRHHFAATTDRCKRSTVLLRRYLSAEQRRIARAMSTPMNMVEKILARKSGQKSVAPGDVVLADVDLMLMHDLSANFVMKVFENEMEGASIADPAKLVFAFDHNFAPATREA